jgi:hypothetical protein
MRTVVLLAGVALLACLAVTCVHADVYLNSPRGSNNRLDEANRDRDNGDRLFDSQNNNRGGVNVGQLYFYTGSTVTLEWTNQHCQPHHHAQTIDASRPAVARMLNLARRCVSPSCSVW